MTFRGQRSKGHWKVGQEVMTLYIQAFFTRSAIFFVCKCARKGGKSFFNQCTTHVCSSCRHIFLTDIHADTFFPQGFYGLGIPGFPDLLRQVQGVQGGQQVREVQVFRVFHRGLLGPRMRTQRHTQRHRTVRIPYYLPSSFTNFMHLPNCVKSAIQISFSIKI